MSTSSTGTYDRGVERVSCIAVLRCNIRILRQLWASMVSANINLLAVLTGVGFLRAQNLNDMVISSWNIWLSESGYVNIGERYHYLAAWD